MKPKIDPALSALIAGRSLEEQIEYVRRHGNHAVPGVLRTSLLGGLGIPKPKPNAENLVIFGCYIPFSNPSMIQDYTKLLDILGLEYTYLEQENCCGLPFELTGAEDERELAKRAERESISRNLDRAREKGAKSIAYCCMGCAYTVKGLVPDDAIRHHYYFELLLERLEETPLRVPRMKVGYYEGCKRRYLARSPGVKVDWEGLRRLLGRVEGLEIIDLPNNLCCTEAADKVVQAAEEKDLDTVLCSCNGCYNRVRTAGARRIQVIYLNELLLRALCPA